MADEVTFSALSDATVAATLHQELLAKLGDRHSLWGHPAIYYAGSVNGTGSNVRKFTLWGADLAPMAAVSDGSSASNTAIGSYVGSGSVTVARQALMFTSTDLAGMTWGFSPATLVEKIAESMATAAKRRFQALLCDIVDGFTTTVGSSGVDFSVTNWFSAKAALQSASAPGPFLAILHPQQLNDLQASLRAETGPMQFVPATAELMALKGQGYAGMFDGVDIFTSSQVPTANAGADRAGALMSYGAVAFADGLVTPQVAVGGIAIGSGPIYVEIERDAGMGANKIVGNYFVGVSKAQDLMGVSIITDS